jgi:aminoglycoside 6'-N-acetyltransferase
MNLRPVTTADIPTLRRWDEEPHVVESDPNDDWNWENEVPDVHDWREQLVAEVDNRPIGFIQIIDPAREETHYWGDCEPNLRAIDIWIGEADALNKGYGTTMMRLALDKCFAPPEVTAVIIDPLERNVRALRFYQRLGFKPVGVRRFGADICLVHRLERADYKAHG